MALETLCTILKDMAMERSRDLIIYRT